jgi:hypothetical protein
MRRFSVLRFAAAATMALALVASAFTLMVLAPTVQAGVLFATAQLDGPSENPPNASPGTGFATVTFDDVAHTLSIDVTFSGLLDNTIAAHIHGPVIPAGNAGVATTIPRFIDFPIGVTSGTYHRTFDTTLSSLLNPAFVTAHGGTLAAAEAALFTAIAVGQAYLDIHTTSFPAARSADSCTRFPSLRTRFPNHRRLPSWQPASAPSS